MIYIHLLVVYTYVNTLIYTNIHLSKYKSIVYTCAYILYIYTYDCKYAINIYRYTLMSTSIHFSMYTIQVLHALALWMEDHYKSPFEISNSMYYSVLMGWQVKQQTYMFLYPGHPCPISRACNLIICHLLTNVAGI